MPKFKFRLATLLRLREATRDERRAQLAEAYRVDDVLAAADCGRGRGTRRAPRAAAARRSGRARSTSIGWSTRSATNWRSRRLAAQLEQQRQAVAAEIERRRQALVEANREVRVLEKLREKQAAPLPGRREPPGHQAAG